MRYDLAVIGSGGAGFAAAITARQLGATVVMVEAGTVGGTCVNTGCVPSKALLAAAEARHLVSIAGCFPGIGAVAHPVGFADLIAGKDDLVQVMRASKYVDLADAYGWPIIAGTARFIAAPDRPVLDVDVHGGGTARIDAGYYLVATGSAPALPAIPGLAEAGYLTSTTAMDLDALPASMIVIGGNAVGLEQAQLFARLGTTVTVVEALDRLAPFDEPEASQAILDAFLVEGITVYTGSTVTGVCGAPGAVTVTMRDGHGVRRDLHAEQLLVATGRRPTSTGLDLDAVGVSVGERGEIVVDDRFCTGKPAIYAAGDVTGGPQFVYVAARQGSVAATNALTGTSHKMDMNALPRVTFTSPALASAGLTDAHAKAAGYACDCRVLPLKYVPRAVIDRTTHGMIKIVADAGTGRILGIHAVADHAGELAAAATYILAAQMTVTQLADLWCPYLTLAEGLKLAAQSFTRDITQLSCCAA